MDTIEKKMSLKKRFLAFFASVAVLAGGVVAGVQADTTTAGNVEVDVVDENGAPLAGAQLQILDSNGNVVVDEIESNGQAQVFTLEAGSYNLHEVAAPEGYEVVPDVPFEVVASQTVHTEIQQNAPPAGDDAAAESEDTGDVAPENETRSAPEAKTQGTLSAVYVGGANANDDNDGSTKESPVATWDKAKELAAPDGTIYVAGTLDVEGDISAQQVVTRAPGFTKGNMFNVKTSAKFTNIHIKGNGETVGNSVIAFEHKGAGNSLVVGQGVTIENFVSTGEGAAVYVSDAAGASVTFDGAKFLKNQALNGGAVAIRTARGNANAKGFKVNVTGGTVFDGNVAKQNDSGTGQGGAIFLNGQFVTNIDNATFKNNRAQYGAAIVNYNEYIGNEINIVNGLVANNKTGNGKPSHGALGRSGLSAGGVNICMSGAAEVNISSQNGVAIFDNAGPKGDIAVWDNSDPSKLKVNEGAMLGGGNHNWQPVGARGYKSAPSAADKAAARASATVIFENNTSDYHGTIMSNSLVQFGKKLAELRIKKIDAVSKKAMAGVVFKLTSESGNVRTATTFVEPTDEGHDANYQDNHDGVASFTNLPDGKYTLEEVTPDGYRGTMPWTVTIQNQQVTVHDNGQGLIQPVEGKYYNFVIRNQPMTVKLSKQALGDDTKELPGAEIVVKDAAGKEVAHWTSTDKPHEFAVEPGEYTLEEVNAPAGFDKITTIVKFTVDEYGQVTVTNAQEVINGEVTVKDVNHLILTDFPKPEVTTDAKDAADGDKYVAPTGTARVTDVVTYTGLIPGKEYTITGTLHKKVDGKDAGVIATKTEKFTPAQANGTIELTFEFDASELAGETLVAFESVKRGDVEVASHADINDEDQTVRVVKIGTLATDGTTGDHIGLAAKETVLNDVVAYTGLKPGQTYTVKGQLVKRLDGTPIEGATAETTFVASESGKGFVTLTFKYDARPLAGFASVAYEYLYEGDVTGQDVNEQSEEFVTKHADKTDEEQTVYYPEVTTSATDPEDDDKVLDPEKTVTVRDTVSYKNLIAGKEYTVSGVLMDKATGEPLLVNGEQVTATKTFTAESKKGSVELEFTFDASALNNKTLVVFETVLYEGKEVAVHADIDDEAQTVEVSTKPSIGTDAKDGADGDKLIEKAAGQTIIDTVKYSNLNTKRTYRVVGELHVKNADGTDGGVLTDKDGNPVAAVSEDFQPADEDGAVEVTFTVDGSELAGKDLVVFEKLYIVRNGEINEADPVATHEKIDAASQTVHVKDNPEIEKYVNQNVHQEIDLSEVFTYDVLAYVTKDADKVVITDTLVDDLQFVSAVSDVKVADLGAENNHTPYGTVAEAGTAVENAVVAIEGQTLTVVIEPANDYRGHWVKVTFDAKIADGKTIADLTYATVEKNDPVLTDEQHEGVPNDASYTVYVDNWGTYEDESNTVTVKPAKIGTNATGKDTQAHAVFNDSQVTVVDVVAYEGLEGGETYTLKGTLVKKSDGAAVATGEATFVAAADGKDMVTMEFTFDASELAGDSVVAFEYLYRGDVVGQDVNEDSDEYVTKHEDIDDEAQTVEVTKPEVSTDAADAADGDKIVAIAEDVVINDVVTFSGLIPGKEYTLDGTLHVKNAEQTALDAKSVVAVAAEGATIMDAEARSFVADAANGTVTLAFTVDTTDIAGEQVVVFESLKFNGVEIAAHADINDAAQTVTVEEEKPAIEKYVNKNVHEDVKLDEVFTYDVLAYVTKDADKVVITDTLVDDLQFVSTAKDVTVVDLGTENDHKPYGTVAKDGTPVKAEAVIDGQTLTVTIDPATAERGHWVKMTFDAKIKDGLQITDLDYAEITENNPVLTDEVHEGVPNKASYEIFVDNKGKYALESNTVTVKPKPETRPEVKTPEIGTTATDNADGDKELAVNSNVTVKDLIEYKNLEPNTVYTFKGQLVVKGTDGKDVVAEGEAVFTTDASGNGTVDMFFDFNTAGLDSKELVAYEYLFKGDVVGQNVPLDSALAKHADDNDQAQTVKVAKKTEETTPPVETPTPERSTAPKVTVRPTVKLPITGLPRTGSAVALAGMAALMLIGGGLVLVRRRES